MAKDKKIRLENDEGEFRLQGRELHLVQDEDALSIVITPMDLQKMKIALESVKPSTSIPSAGGLGKATMICSSLDDGRRREICFALFNQLNTQKLEEVAIELNVIALPLPDSKGKQA